MLKVKYAPEALHTAQDHMALKHMVQEHMILDHKVRPKSQKALIHCLVFTLN